MIRLLIARHHHVALAIAIVALAIKMMVPIGYMPGTAANGIAITVCNGMSAETFGSSIQPGTHKQHDDSRGEHPPCPFASLGLLSTVAIDPPLLIAANRFVIRSGLWPSHSPDTAVPAFLRPPLRGPPPTT